MGYALGIGIPVVIVGVFAVLIWLLARSGLKKKKRNEGLKRYARSRGYRYVGDDLNGRLEGERGGRRLSVEFAIVQCSADPAAGPKSYVARMIKQETVLRMTVGGDSRALVSKPFFRNAIHDPLRGVDPVELGDAAFQRDYQVFALPGARCDWLDPAARAELSQLRARELRLDHGELSLNLDEMVMRPKRIDRGLALMASIASRL